MGVRNESVRLSLEDAGFSTKMAQDAAAAVALAKALDMVDGKNADLAKSYIAMRKEADTTHQRFKSGSNDLDSYSVRLGLLVKAAGALGPAIAPLGTAAVAGIAGLASQLGFAAIGVTSLVVASRGLGDALQAVEKAELDPTVQNLEAARAAMEKLGPDAQQFVAQLQELRPVFADIRNQAGAGWFPGLSEALDHFEEVAPRVGRIFKEIGEAGGNLVADAAESLAGPEWADFLTFVKREAPAALEDLGHSAGALVHGMSRLWMAFSPLNNDFGDWLVRMSRGFDDWASNLAQTDGFREFVDYIRTNGPKVGDAVAGIANALLQIVEAAAPLGGPVLDALTGIANAIAAVADSPLGTPIMVAVTAMSAMSLAANVGTAAVTRLNGALLATGAASSKAATGLAAIQGGPAGIAAAIGLSNLPDAFDNITQVLNGDRNPIEGMARLVAGMSPVGEVAELVGINVFGTGEKFVQAAADAALLDLKNRSLATSTARAADIQLQLAERTARVRAAMAEQAEAVAQTADQWTDFSHKVQLGKTSVEQLMNRWEKLGEASANMAENIQDALLRGVDENVLKTVIDQLGPQGAAAALEEFAHATGRRAKEIKAQFELMGGGARSFGDSYDLLVSLVNGTPLTMGDDLIFELDQAKGAFDSLPKDVRTEIRAEGIPQTQAAVDKLVEKYQLTERERKALVTLRDNASPTIKGILDLLGKVKDKHVTVTTTFIRELITKRSTMPQPHYTNDGLNDLLDVNDGPGRSRQSDRSTMPAAPGAADPWTSTDVPLTRGRDTELERWSRHAGFALKSFANATRATGASFDSALDSATESVDQERKSRERLLTMEQRAVQEKIAALRQEREAIIASVEARLADPFNTGGGRTAADFLGDTSGMTSMEIYQQQQLAQEIADSLQQSPTDVLEDNVDQLGQLSQLIRQLKALGLHGDALAALIASGDIGQIQALIAGGQSGVRQYQHLYNQQQHLAHQVGLQAFGATGGAAELQHLVAQNRRLEDQLKELNRRQTHTADHAARQRDKQISATKHVGKDTAGELNRSSSRAMTGARRRG